MALKINTLEGCASPLVGEVPAGVDQQIDTGVRHTLVTKITKTCDSTRLSSSRQDCFLFEAIPRVFGQRDAPVNVVTASWGVQTAKRLGQSSHSTKDWTGWLKMTDQKVAGQKIQCYQRLHYNEVCSFLVFLKHISLCVKDYFCKKSMKCYTIYVIFCLRYIQLRSEYKVSKSLRHRSNLKQKEPKQSQNNLAQNDHSRAFMSSGNEKPKRHGRTTITV